MKRYIHTIKEVEIQKIMTDIETHSFKTVIFLDLAPTEEMVKLIKSLSIRGITVSFIDHHMPRKGDFSEQGCKTRSLFLNISSLVGAARCFIGTREEFPSCYSLAITGLFAKEEYVVAHDDIDGAMTAALLHGDFERLSPMEIKSIAKDVDLLDGPRQCRTEADGMSPLGCLVNQAFSSIPSFNKDRPEERASAWIRFTELVISSYNRDSRSVEEIKRMGLNHKDQADESVRLAKTAKEVAPGWLYLDATNAGRYDLATLVNELGGICRIVKKTSGPIATACGGIQYSLESETLDLPSLASRLLGVSASPEPKDGFIGNIPQRIHLSEDYWNRFIQLVKSQQAC